jgi:hypothetical protein
VDRTIGVWSPLAVLLEKKWDMGSLALIMQRSWPLRMRQTRATPSLPAADNPVWQQTGRNRSQIAKHGFDAPEAQGDRDSKQIRRVATSLLD